MRANKDKELRIVGEILRCIAIEGRRTRDNARQSADVTAGEVVEMRKTDARKGDDDLRSGLRQSGNAQWKGKAERLDEADRFPLTLPPSKVLCDGVFL